MANMTYHDLPVLRSNGWEISGSGASWFKRDNQGRLWQASDFDDSSNLLTFRVISEVTPHNRMTREKFEELFNAG